MSQDVEWYRYLNDLSYITPKNAWLSQLSVAFSVGCDHEFHRRACTGRDRDRHGQRLRAASHVDVASWLDAVAKEHGWNNAYFSNSAVTVINNTTAVKFTSSINVTAAALSHRYDRKAG